MSVFGSGGKKVLVQFWFKYVFSKKKKRYITTGKKRYSRLSDGCAVLAITTGKKRYSHLSGGLCCCISFWFWWEISIFFVVAGNFDYNRKKKIQSSVGGKLAVLLVWREIFITTGKKRYITTGKKKYSHLSDGCVVLAITTGKKQRYSRLSGGLCYVTNLY